MGQIMRISDAILSTRYIATIDTLETSCASVTIMAITTIVTLDTFGTIVTIITVNTTITIDTTLIAVVDRCHCYNLLIRHFQNIIQFHCNPHNQYIPHNRETYNRGHDLRYNRHTPHNAHNRESCYLCHTWSSPHNWNCWNN